MHFIGVPLIVLSLIFTTVGVTAVEGVSALASHKALRQHCGPGHVLNTTTIHVNGHDLNMTTASCPWISNDDAIPALQPRAEKRQAQICDTDCTVSCDVPTANAPFINDCNLLTNALEGLFPQSLSAPAQTVTSFEMFTCGVFFFNLDFVDMNYCYLDIGFHLAIIANHCFPTFDGPTVSSDGFCIPPQTPGNSWAIEGYNAA